MILGVLVLLAVGLLGGGWVWRQIKPPSVEAASEALRRKDHATALELARRILSSEPSSRPALLVAGRAAMAMADYETALQYLEQVPDEDSEIALRARVKCAELCVQLGRLSDAEVHYRRALAQHSDYVDAHKGLLNILRLETRSWDAQPHLLALFRKRSFNVTHLNLAGNLESIWISTDTDVPFLSLCSGERPDDPLPLLGPLRLLMAQAHELEFVKEELTDLTKKHPEALEAHVMLGQVLLDFGELDALVDWDAALPAGAEDHPLIWQVRGRAAHRRGNREAAVRCLWESIRRYPNDRAANLLIAKMLGTLDRTNEAALFHRRGDLLQQFDDLLLRGESSEGRPTPETLTQMILKLQELGRLWEALGWSRALESLDPQSMFAQKTIARLTAQLSEQTPLTLTQSNPALSVDLSAYPLPQGTRATTSPEPDSKLIGAIAFQNQAAETGLNFSYLVDYARRAQLVYTFDFVGGGAGVIDFDSDGRPDLYLTQGIRWLRPEADDPGNSLFRNQSGESFQDVGSVAGVDDHGYGQGVAVGDIDNDGFADLYVANIGPNRLYRNNGDGTFSDETSLSGTAGDHYSLSAAFVDLNQDALPDLYVVNYLGGDALARQCEREGKPIQCPPTDFPGQQDRLYLNLGDGRFQDVTETSGVVVSSGPRKGMGVLAADFDGQGGLDLLVTNDTNANFLFLNRTEPGSSTIQLEDQGSQAGVGYDELGRLQGSMGIAAADVNSDHRLDLFVTNFYHERNNLFLQAVSSPLPLYEDRESEQLDPSSVQEVGWGAKFLDADLDGDPDLVLANGHLDHNTSGLGEGRMLPRVFENLEGRRFESLPAEKTGSYFAEPYFGRAIARLDWNEDGKEDLCVTHMGAPVALLTNRSNVASHSLRLQLRGTTSSRDAVGARVEVTSGDVKRTVWLVAGDGFQASDQRQLVVGLGPRQAAETVTVHWPGGRSQEYPDLQADRTWILVEGAAARELPGSRTSRP